MADWRRPQGRREPGEAPGAGARTILVVDGDECVRELLDLHLSGAGYRVVTAKDALAAVRFVLREPPDLIIGDVNMKYLDGLEFLAALRDDGRTRHVPVIFLTGSDARVERALGLGAQAYLTRPVLAGRLLRVVAEQLARSLMPPDLLR